jgi:sec-independent protein translocase protein TatA
MGFFHWPELIVLLLVALVIFGPKRLPEIGASLGKGIKEFRKSTSGHEDETEPSNPAQIPPAHSEDVRMPDKPVETSTAAGERESH